MSNFPIYIQSDSMACGATALYIIAKYYGIKVEIHELIDLCETTKEGTSLFNIAVAANKIGFEASGHAVTFEELMQFCELPCIAYWNQNHFVVVYKIKKNYIYVSDPAHGLIKYTYQEFKSKWLNAFDAKGFVLLIRPVSEVKVTNKIVANIVDFGKQNEWQFIKQYLQKYKWVYFQLMFGLLIGSLTLLIFPFLTQSIVDIGIRTKDLDFITLILCAQLMLFISRNMLEVFRIWTLMQISIRINLSLIRTFILKLMKLPMSFFDLKMTGDLLQRIWDNSKIEEFLTVNALRAAFSLLNIVVFGIVLGIYNKVVFFVFVLGTLIYIFWIYIFMKKRADLDYKLFIQHSLNQGKLVEVFTSMHEIKINNAEVIVQREIENMQLKLFNFNFASLKLNQLQIVGSNFINELKNIIISYYSAQLVVNNQISVGAMLSISYIVGQLNAPVLDIVMFSQGWQNAKLSIRRLIEIQKRKEETSSSDIYIHNKHDIIFKNVFFKYDGSQTETLHDLSFKIEANKTTALVGASGCGKTTLIKLLLRFYEPNKGSIYVGDKLLSNINTASWRNNCAAVLQEGVIFSDTIKNNVIINPLAYDELKFWKSLKAANIDEFVQGLPLGLNTKVGSEGIGLSTGQKQRLLIARAVYRSPEFVFLDEATSALDTNNEKQIINNLKAVFNNKTVLVIAHRLSTVRNADLIIVLNKGNIVEQGTHNELLKRNGFYYELVKNQLEI